MDKCKEKIDLGHYWNLKGYASKPNLIYGIFLVGIWHYDSMVLCSLKEKKTVKPQFNKHPFNKVLRITPHILPVPWPFVLQSGSDRSAVVTI